MQATPTCNAIGARSSVPCRWYVWHSPWPFPQDSQKKQRKFALSKEAVIRCLNGESDSLRRRQRGYLSHADCSFGTRTLSGCNSRHFHTGLGTRKITTI